MSQYEEVVLKQYGPERSGENVAWVHAHSVHEGAGYLNITTGVVGSQGALFNYLLDTDDGRRLNSGDSVRGLKPSLHAEVLIRTDSDAPYADEQSVWGYPDADGGHLVRVLSRHTESDTDIVWAEGGREIASAIRAELGRIGLEGAYNYAYYAVNGLIGQNIKNDKDARRLLIADPEMKDVTAAQLEAAQKVLDTLYDLKGLGALSLGLLGLQQPSLRIDEILSRFQDNDSNSTAITERLRNDLIKKLIFSRNLRYGRDWPYRDDQLLRAPQIGEDIHYYVEQIDRTNSYLADRIIPYAYKGYMVLSALSEAERG